MSDAFPPNEGQAPLRPEEGGEEALELTRFEALEAEIAELNDRVLRLAAEVENTRRRGERERQDASRYAIAGFARDLLGVADNLARALGAAPEEGAASPETVSGFVAGVRMTERALLAALERHGVKKIDPKGEKFDPHLHQAVAQIPSAMVPAGMVAETAQPGFVIGDRVLRAAMVVVSSGEEAPPPAGGHVDTSA